MIHIFFFIPRVNEDIINKDDNEQVQVRFEHPIHQIHESFRRIGLSKRHNYNFIMIIQSSKGSFQNITVFDTKLMITRSVLYLWEMNTTLKLFKQVKTSWGWDIYFRCDLVQLSIVIAHYERTIFLLYEQHWRTPWWNTRPDEALI